MEAYPLQWPLGYKRTEQRTWSQFKQSMESAQNFLRDEIRRMGAADLVVSTNLPIRKDGMLYTDSMKRKIDDPGAAIYFNYKGKPISMCCDKYLSVGENIYALGKGIEALRGLERWGISDFLDRAFTGFMELPENAGPSTQEKWYEVLEVDPKASLFEIKVAYKLKTKQSHPDSGGSTEEFLRVKAAYDQGIKSFS